jgi:hypothetical protein
MRWGAQTTRKFMGDSCADVILIHVSAKSGNFWPIGVQF